MRLIYIRLNQRKELSRLVARCGVVGKFFLRMCRLQQADGVALNRGAIAVSNGAIGLLILSMVILSACETVIEIDPPDYESELTITSNFTPDSVWSATITKTLPIGDLRKEAEAFLTDATVMIYQGESLIDRLVHDAEVPGRYVSSKGLRPEDTIPYRMVAEAPGLRSVSGTSMAPLAPEVTNAEIVQLSAPDVFGDSEYQVNFSLTNRPGLNYYSFTIIYGFLEESITGTIQYRIEYVYMRYDSPWWYCNFTDLLNPVAVPIGDDYGCAIGVLSDRSIDEPTLDFEIEFDLPEEVLGQPDTDLILAVLALSPEYVEYQGSVEEHEDFYGFGQPVNLYSNIEGGRGIFAGYSATYRLFDQQSLE